MKTIFTAGYILLTIAGISQSTQLVIPDTLSGSNFVLNMHKDSVQFFPGNITHTYAFNANKILGPTLILQKNTNVNISVNNQIGDTTTVHWHGLHVPSKWDGGPHTTIAPATTWNPQFTVLDHAATYWYHPHTHMKTAEQAIKGAAGLIIVRDAAEQVLNLPRKYGADDFPVIVQVAQFDSLNQPMPLGMQDSTVLINGARASYGSSVYANFPAQIVRMRLLNASGERVINFGLSGNKNFYQIASDGGLLNSPFDTTRVRLAPRERAEILLDLNGMNGQTLYLMCYGSELPMGVQGGPTMPMPSGPPMNSPLNGVDYNLMLINVVAQTSSPVTSVPSALVNNTPYLPSQANVTRTIRFTADSAMVMDGPFYFNDSSFNMMRVDYTIPINSIEIWKLVNHTMVAHPFHIHDVQFYLIDRNGYAPGPQESGRKDVVLVPSGDSVMFITKFEDFADTLVPYMYHCHILMHEDDGMMGQFIVNPDPVGISGHMISTILNVFPNPASSELTIRSKIEKGTCIVYDNAGREVFRKAVNQQQFSIDVSAWKKGLYIIELADGNTTGRKKISII